VWSHKIFFKGGCKRIWSLKENHFVCREHTQWNSFGWYRWEIILACRDRTEIVGSYIKLDWENRFKHIQYILGLIAEIQSKFKSAALWRKYVKSNLSFRSDQFTLRHFVKSNRFAGIPEIELDFQLFIFHDSISSHASLTVALSALSLTDRLSPSWSRSRMAFNFRC
jgi:hypothetical protein